MLPLTEEPERVGNLGLLQIWLKLMSEMKELLPNSMETQQEYRWQMTLKYS